MNILIQIAYDGTNYSGFQVQNNGITVQEKIEKALLRIYNEDIRIKIASRTDAGVHAIGQIATYVPNKNILPLRNIPLALNTFLPKDIIVNYAEEKEEAFHPRYDAKEKNYEYKILSAPFPIPQLRNYSFYQRLPLDFEKMQEAAKYFIGTHDFKAFSSKGSSVKTTIRTIYNVYLIKNDNIITIYITGDGFLYNMIRIIAGTLLNVGLGKIKPEDINEIILSKNRLKAGITLSPGGLTLLKVIY